MGPLSGSLEFAVEEGKITAIAVTPDEKSKQKFARPTLWTCAGPELDDGWETGTLAEAGFDQTAIQELTKGLASGDYGNIHAVLIEQDDHLVYEEYFSGEANEFGAAVFTRESRHDLRSVSKSVTSAILGAALGPEFEVALDKPFLDFFPELADSAGAGVETITLRHVLTMTSGLEWNEMQVPYTNPRNDEVRQFRATNPIAYVLSRPTTETPGERFYYNSGLTEVIGGVIQRITAQPLSDYAQEVLFEPLGITDCEWWGPPTYRSKSKSKFRMEILGKDQIVAIPFGRAGKHYMFSTFHRIPK